MFKFKGGVHPKDHKEYSAESPVEVLPVPKKLFIPLKHHWGETCVPIVKIGELVRKGDVLATSKNKRTSDIHASSSGKVVDIGNYPHPLITLCPTVVIETDGRDEWRANHLVERDYTKLSSTELINLIYLNSIVGMGGAAFPAHVKLQVHEEKKIHTLFINGAECEPYMTSDYRMMVEQAPEIIKGALIVMQILEAEHCYFGIEDNKPKAIEIVREAARNTNIKVIALKTKYPQGYNKLMIKAVIGKEIPSRIHLVDTGLTVHNVGTLIAISQAVSRNIPSIERVIAVSGLAVKTPKNLFVKIGTPFKDIFNYCGGFAEKPKKILMGGAMMGYAQSNLDVPVIKATSGILAMTERETFARREHACIRCGRCINACPMRLRPNMLSILSERGKHELSFQKFNLKDCVECGCCAYVCPSNRDIVNYIRLSKTVYENQQKLKK